MRTDGSKAVKSIPSRAEADSVTLGAFGSAHLAKYDAQFRRPFDACASRGRQSKI
jgi:hypothetical protein